MKCWRCGNQLTTGDVRNDICNRCNGIVQSKTWHNVAPTDMNIMFNKFRDAQAHIATIEREVARLRDALEHVKTCLLYGDDKVGPIIDEALDYNEQGHTMEHLGYHGGTGTGVMGRDR